jgi:hypothetical protein
MHIPGVLNFVDRTFVIFRDELLGPGDLSATIS